MHVIDGDQSGFKGYVTRASNGEPINDVKVIAGDQYVYTESNGYYEFPLEQGVYNVHFVREGYHPVIVEDTTALPGFSTLDVQMEAIQYYFIAGQVFAGDPHIESGIAYGYKMLEGTVVDVYAEMTGDGGWYEFSGLSTAQYIIKAEPSPNSMYYGDFLPTYYGDVLHWEDATVINLTQGTESAHIHLVPATASAQGPGSISGIISNETGRSGAANIPIILRSEDPEFSFITYSSSDGSFLFSGLNYGNYELFAEIPGKSTIPQTIALDEVHNAVSGIEMLIQQTKIIFVGLGLSDLPELSPVIYPNPVTDHLNISLNPEKPLSLIISVTDIAGRVILKEEHFVSGPETISLDASTLANGVYNVIIEANGRVMQQKIIK
jgi:hypothetical protein